MSYLVLARKYRPQTLSTIIGQEHITKALANAIIRGRVPHALLFTGPRGVGKTTSARVLAKALNCTGRVIPSVDEVKANPELYQQAYGQLEPCGECSNCKDITRGASLAVLEIDGASHNSVENVRDLIETLQTSPPPGLAYKIYIIDEVHMLSNAAFNALLKSLEEPPNGTIFIFATTEPHKIPETVLSRCQQHDFRRIPLKIIVQQLKEIVHGEAFDVDDEVLNLIARRCQGGMRDATTLLDRVCASSDGKVSTELVSRILGVFDMSHFREIVEAVLDNDPSLAIETIGRAFSRSIEVRAYLGDFLEVFRLLSLYSLASKRGDTARVNFVALEELSDAQEEHLAFLAGKANPDLCAAFFEQAREVVDQAIRSEYPRYVLEAGLINLCRSSEILPLSEVLREIGSLVSKSGSRIPLVGIQDQVKKKTDKPIEPESDHLITPPVQSLALYSEGDNEAINFDNVQNEAAPASNFMWKDFVNFLRSGNDLRLDAYLRRAAPVNFSVESGGNGILELLAPAFVIQALDDNETNKTLRERLSSFAKVSNWNIKLQLHEDVSGEHETAPDSRIATGRPVTGNPATRSVSNGRPSPVSNKLHVPGSIAANTEKKIKKQIAKVEEEAREDKLVKTALELFEGSSIDRILPLTRG